MVPFSSLNEARRRLVTAMESVRLQDNRPYHPVAPEEFARRLHSLTSTRVTPVQLPQKPKLTVAVSETAAARAALAAGADRVYLTAEQWQDRPPVSHRDLAALIKEATAWGKEVFPALPRLWHPAAVGDLRTAMELLRALNPQGVLVSGPGGWEAARCQFPSGLVADYPFNVYNKATAVFLKTSGFAGLTVSPELNRRQLSALAPLAARGGEIIVHGNFPLMVSAYCPLQAGSCSRACRQGGYLDAVASLTEKLESL
jgi:putative protease